MKEELRSGDPARLRDEIGDLLIATAGLAQTLSIDPEEALRRSLAKLEGRLRSVEAGLAAENRELADASAEELLRRWEQAKRSAG